MRFVLQVAASLWLATAAIGAGAAEYKPYPAPHVSQEQWQRYYDEVAAELGASAQRFADLHLVVFSDSAGASYAFTQPGHPAHPAWIARRIVSKDGRMFLDQVGYFAGDEEPFAALFQQYQQLNERMMEELERKAAPK